MVTTSDAASQFFIVVEKEILVESCDMKTALLDLVATYFAFNIAYPKPLYPPLVFVQHYIFNICDVQVEPNCVGILLTGLNKV